MKTVTINVLASDFENNSFMNYNIGLQGCPLTRAFTRAGLASEYSYHNYFPDMGLAIDNKVARMFAGKAPIEDFSFEVQIPDQYDNELSETRPSSAIPNI